MTEDEKRRIADEQKNFKPSTSDNHGSGQANEKPTTNQGDGDEPSPRRK